MSRALSRQELIAIVERLMPDHARNSAEAMRLADLFEANVPRPFAADLIFNWGHEFKDAAEIVDFALGQDRVKTLSRRELIEVARKLMTSDIANEIESHRLCSLFNANVPHPGGTDLIFYPKIEFDSPEALVDYALAYKPPKVDL